MWIYAPIESHALIGDRHGSALVTLDGTIDWCCFRRFDARPVFAAILDARQGGTFSIRPADEHGSTRRYLPGTNVLETTFRTRSGTVTVTDLMVLRAPEAAEPPHRLVRAVRCVEGEVRVRMDLRPRFDYGLTVPDLTVHAPDLAAVVGSADALAIWSEMPLESDELCHATSDQTLRAGDERLVTVTHLPAHLAAPHRPDRAEIEEQIRSTIEMWRGWSDRCTYEGPYRDAVIRSALVLKALTYEPTGAIVAAPTASLPEHIGGSRNWDYRYTWIRDAALILYALDRIGYEEEADRFMHWVMRTTAGSVEDLQVLYGIGGERLIFENEIDGLDGYEGSRPVRIGNGATTQFQLDVYGELLDTAWMYHRDGGHIDDRFWAYLRAVVDLVCERWMRPDRGWWEVRGREQHLVSSKVFAWVALDRALRLAKARGDVDGLDRWHAVRDEMRARVERDGVDPATGAFISAFGETTLDATALLFPLVRFLPADDPRVRSTVEQIEKHLARGELVYRYRDVDDGLPGDEGAFVICSFWLVDNLAMMGDVERAREMFEALFARANDVGLFAEEIDPDSGRFLGNFPQAFSHSGLIGAAINLQKAEDGRSGRLRRAR